MKDVTLVLIEASGIQDYIFGSNQLAQNIGASELVARSTSQWLVDELEEYDVASNVTWQKDGLLYRDKTLADGLAAEVVYTGGGNGMLLFADDGQAQAFIKKLTYRVLTEARGLQLVAIRERFNWDRDSLAELHEQLRGKLAARKLNRPLSVPLLGLGVTATCVFTGLPAIGWDNDPAVVGEEAAKKAERIESEPKLIAAEVADKLRSEIPGRERLHTILPQVRKKGFEFVYDFGDFGTKNESSYIAVIHADANAMGNRFANIADSYREPEQNGEYVKELRTFSNSVKKIAKEAPQKTVGYLLASLDDDNKFGGKIPIPERVRRDGRKVPLLPFRPIVFGGDDITFVCDGRLGLPLAAKYLQEFTSGKLADDKPVYARAGVAVVKSHYPFSRAYQLSEALAAEAKNSIGTFMTGEESDTVMDWHFATTGVIYGLEQIREREFLADNGHSLLMRPILLPLPESDNNAWRTWQIFRELVETFQDEKEWPRNKLKALREVLRRGSEAVELFRENYRLKLLPDIPNQLDMCEEGWQGEDCGYFDAIEAIDFFVSLDAKGRAG
jgi:hypothetical protein